MRNSFFSLLLGTNGTGKTTFLRKMVSEARAVNRRCLIVTPDAAEWRDIETLDLSDIKHFTGTKRIIYEKGIIDFLQINLRGAFLVLDDYKAYGITRGEHESVRKLCVRRRQRELDIAIVAHGFTEVVPYFIYTFLTHLVLFRTLDNFTRVAHNIQNAEGFKAKVAHINKQAIKDKHYHEIILLRE